MRPARASQASGRSPGIEAQDGVCTGTYDGCVVVWKSWSPAQVRAFVTSAVCGDRARPRNVSPREGHSEGPLGGTAQGLEGEGESVRAPVSQEVRRVPDGEGRMKGT